MRKGRAGRTVLTQYGEQPMNNDDIVLLPTKINRPSLTARVIERNDLLKKLNRGLDHSLMTVVSPAGSGKTTAVLTWANDLKDTPIAWCLLEKDDNTLDRFFLYLTASLRTVDECICRSLGSFPTSDNPSAVFQVLDSFLYQIGEYQHDFVCVLEDFHAIQDSDEVSDALHYLFKHLPQNAHFVITSRVSLKIPTRKMKLENRLYEINESDLLFTEEEIGRFFAQMGVVLKSEERKQVLINTKGWATGNKLIAFLCGTGSPVEIEDAIRRAKPSIEEYLFEEIFSVLPANQQQFLLRTATVSSFSLSLAEEIAGISRQEATDVIEELMAGDLFIEQIKRGEGEIWYRYHLLFSEMLTQRLSRVADESVMCIRKQARDWFIQNGFLDYAIEVSAELKDYETIRQLIIDNWMNLYMTDRQARLLSWAAPLPEKFILASPLLCAVLALSYIVKGDLDKAGRYINSAISRLHENEDFLFAFCMVQMSFLSSFRGDTDDMIAYAEKALRYLPEKEYYLRGMMEQVLASAWYETKPLLSKNAFYKAMKMQVPLGNRGLSCSAYCNIAWVCANLGHFDESAYYAQQAFALFEGQECQDEQMLSFAYLCEMLASYQKENIEAISSAYKSFKKTTNAGAVPAHAAEALALFSKAQWWATQGTDMSDFEKALDINESGALLSFPSLEMAKQYGENFTTTAREKARIHTDKKHMQLFYYSVRLHVKSDQFLHELIQFVEDIDPEERLLKLHALVLLAACAESEQETARAEKTLLDALSFAQRISLSMPIKENMKYLQPILQRLTSRSLAANEKATVEAFLEEAAEKNKPFSLTKREREIMQLVAAGKTVQDTADALYLSRDTIKKHLKSIYAKLDVHSKLEAISILRDRGIL